MKCSSASMYVSNLSVKLPIPSRHLSKDADDFCNLYPLKIIKDMRSFLVKTLSFRHPTSPPSKYRKAIDRGTMETRVYYHEIEIRWPGNIVSGGRLLCHQKYGMSHYLVETKPPSLEFVYVGALEWKNLPNSNITLIIIRDHVNTIYLKEVRSNQCFYPQQHNTLCLDD